MYQPSQPYHHGSLSLPLLHWAVRGDFLPVARALVDHGTNVDVVSPEVGWGNRGGVTGYPLYVQISEIEMIIYIPWRILLAVAIYGIECMYIFCIYVCTSMGLRALGEAP